MCAVFALILFRLFQLQVVQGEKYSERIKSQSVATEELIARRGDILVKDVKTGEYIQMALNTSVDELRIDAQEIPDKKLAADLIAPLIFTEEDYEVCQKDTTLCPEGLVPVPAEPEDEPPAEFSLDPETPPDEAPEMAHFIFPPYSEALQKKKEDIFRKIDTKNRYVLIKRQITPQVSRQDP